MKQYLIAGVLWKPRNISQITWEKISIDINSFCTYCYKYCISFFSYRILLCALFVLYYECNYLNQANHRRHIVLLMIFVFWDIIFGILQLLRKNLLYGLPLGVNYSILNAFVNYVLRGHSTVQPACYRLFCVFVYSNEANINARSTQCIFMQRLVTNFREQMLAVSYDSH